MKKLKVMASKILNGLQIKKRKFDLFLTEAKVDHQETSQNIGAYLLKWYMLSRDAMLSVLKNKILQ